MGKWALVVFAPTRYAFFRSMTQNKMIIIGSKPLPNRQNVLLTRHCTFPQYPNLIIRTSLALLFKTIEPIPPDNVFVVGAVCQLLLNYCSTAYIAQAPAIGKADTYFPNLDTLSQWELAQTKAWEQAEAVSFRFCTYENKNVKKRDNTASEESIVCGGAH